MVTIITPTYNRCLYLGNAIESVLNQTYKDLEFIIVDDNPIGSEARKQAEALINKYANDNRIRYIQNKRNLGGAGSRNVGIELAKGEYIAFLDDDDVYLPDRIEAQIVPMIKNDWEVCVMDGATYKFETGEKLTERHQRLKSGMTNDELIRSHLLYHISGTNTFMFKTSFIRQIGGFDVVPSCQEYILMQKALDAKPRFGYIPEVHIMNYQHEGEQLSTGEKKLIGQRILFENKKRYFHLLTKDEKGKVICRHHGVLFFVHFKMHHYGKAFVEAIKCFLSSPSNAIMWMKEYKGKIKS